MYRALSLGSDDQLSRNHGLGDALQSKRLRLPELKSRPGHCLRHRIGNKNVGTVVGRHQSRCDDHGEPKCILTRGLIWAGVNAGADSYFAPKKA